MIDPSRLNAQLLNTGLSSRDNPLYQILHELISGLLGLTGEIKTIKTTVDDGNSSGITTQGQTIIINRNRGKGDGRIKRILLSGSGTTGATGTTGIQGNIGQRGRPGKNAKIRVIPGPAGLTGTNGTNGRDGTIGLRGRPGKTSRPRIIMLGSTTTSGGGGGTPGGVNTDVQYNNAGVFAGRGFAQFGYYSPVVGGDILNPEILFNANGDTVDAFISTV
jgi:hypothetical protein